MSTTKTASKPRNVLPCIRRQDWGRSSSDPMRETITEVGWPCLHLRILRHYHTWKGVEERTDSDFGFVVGPVFGCVLQGSFSTGNCPDTDEEGWPE